MRRIRLRTILLGVNLLVLTVPLAGIYSFHLYENQLVRQVETELTAQGAYAASFYKAALHQQAGTACASVTMALLPERHETEPTLNLAADSVLASRPDAAPAILPVDPVALQAGQAAYPVLSEASRATLAGFRIVDCHGIVVAGLNEVGQSLLGTPEIRAALDGHYQAALRARHTDNPHPPLASISRGANIRVFVAMPIDDGDRVVGAILLSRTPRNIAESLYDEHRAVFSAAVLAVGFTCLLALLTSWAVGQPITALREQALRIGRGESCAMPLAHPVTLEIEELSRSLVGMDNRLGERAAYIRDFAAHMSHEFKTPLTSIQGALELIHEHRDDMDAGQMERFLSNAIKDTERLKLLVARLLELARADMTQIRDESCDLEQVVVMLRGYFPALVVTVNDDGPVPLPTDVVQAVLTTLLTNSAQHGATTVSIVSERGAIIVTDNGRGVSPANVDKLFVPFFTTRRNAGGTGLGLVIVRSMLAAYHATIVHGTGMDGAAFIIALPRGERHGVAGKSGSMGKRQ